MANMGVSGSGIAGGLGKGAWDCDRNEAIPPELESTVFEEQPTSELNYEGIPTVPTRKNLTHMSFFCNGCRYRCVAEKSRPGRELLLSFHRCQPSRWYDATRKCFRTCERFCCLLHFVARRLEAYPDWTARRVKEALFAGGITRQNKPHLSHISDTKGIQTWSDIVRTSQ